MVDMTSPDVLWWPLIGHAIDLHSPRGLKAIVMTSCRIRSAETQWTMLIFVMSDLEKFSMLTTE